MELIVREDVSLEVLHFYMENDFFQRNSSVCYDNRKRIEHPKFVQALFEQVKGIDTVCFDCEHMFIAKKCECFWEDMLAYVLGVLQDFVDFNIVRIDFMHDKEAEGEIILDGYISAFFGSASLSKKSKSEFVM